MNGLDLINSLTGQEQIIFLLVISTVLLIMVIGVVIVTVRQTNINKQMRKAGLDYETLHNLCDNLYVKAKKADSESESSFYSAQYMIINELKNKSLNISK